jgi:FtsZ-interacting cell division protein ZipA
MPVDPLILLIIGGVIVAAILVAALAMWWRRRRWQREFGPEYDRAVERTGSKSEAIEELKHRKERRARFDIRPLDPAARTRFQERWRRTQSDFVDDPGAAVLDAHKLITEVMATRGYPVENFEQRAADLSVDHPDVVEHYRAANDLVAHAQKGNPGDPTEERRQAMVHLRHLFEALVEATDGDESVDERPRRSA